MFASRRRIWNDFDSRLLADINRVCFLWERMDNCKMSGIMRVPEIYIYTS